MRECQKNGCVKWNATLDTATATVRKKYIYVCIHISSM